MTPAYDRELCDECLRLDRLCDKHAHLPDTLERFIADQKPAASEDDGMCYCMGPDVVCDNCAASEDGAMPGEPPSPPETPAQVYLHERGAVATQEWQDGFNEAVRHLFVQPESGASEDGVPDEMEAFQNAMEDAHGYRPQLWATGVPMNGRDADRFDGWQLARRLAASGDAYVSEQGSVTVDWDDDPQRQLSIMVKRDGSVSFAAYANGQRFSGDAKSPEFWRALSALAASGQGVEGWKLVPVVPTEQMTIAGFESDAWDRLVDVARARNLPRHARRRPTQEKGNG